MKKKNINAFVVLVFLALISAMLSHAYDNSALKMLSLGVNVLIIAQALAITGVKKIIAILNKPVVVVCTLILCINFILSPYEPRYSLLIKYLGYFSVFCAGRKLAIQGYGVECRNIELYALIAIPLLVVALFDRTDMRTTFFANSNVFVYMGLCSAMFYMFLKGIGRKAICVTVCILLAYVLVGTSLGVIVALVGAFFILNIKRINIAIILLIGLVIVLFVSFSEISVAVRIRDTIAVYQALDWYEWTHLHDINFYDLQQRVNTTGPREDNTSSLWRIAQWSGLLTEYIKYPQNIPFGIGADFSIAKTGLPPHNDHLIILVEYGVIVYGAIFKGIVKVHRRLRNEKIYNLILAVIFYHFTENLVDTFPPNCLFYFMLGYLYNCSLCRYAHCSK